MLNFKQTKLYHNSPQKFSVCYALRRLKWWGWNMRTYAVSNKPNQRKPTHLSLHFQLCFLPLLCDEPAKSLWWESLQVAGNVCWMKKARSASRRMCKPNIIEIFGVLHLLFLSPKPTIGRQSLKRTTPCLRIFIVRKTILSDVYCVDPLHTTKGFPKTIQSSPWVWP